MNFILIYISPLSRNHCYLPADTLLSKINKQKGAEGQSVTSRLLSMSRELGVKGLFTGLGPRIVMVATLTAGQFAIYGDIKRVLGMYLYA